MKMKKIGLMNFWKQKAGFRGQKLLPIKIVWESYDQHTVKMIAVQFNPSLSVFGVCPL